jgi:hypothetical protein
MPRQNWPARWCGRLGGALRYLLIVNDNNLELVRYYFLKLSLLKVLILEQL